MADRLTRLEAALDEAVQATPAPMRTVIAALQALRGVAQVSAATIVAELGQVSRFGRPRQLMSYSGTVASEHSSGDRIRRGGITKTGNAHLRRRIVIEAAWAYRHRPARGRALLKRQQPVSEEVKAIAWKAQHRLHARYRTLTARGNSKQQVVTAVGRRRPFPSVVAPAGVGIPLIPGYPGLSWVSKFLIDRIGTASASKWCNGRRCAAGMSSGSGGVNRSVGSGVL